MEELDIIDISCKENQKKKAQQKMTAQRGKASLGAERQKREQNARNEDNAYRRRKRYRYRKRKRRIARMITLLFLLFILLFCFLLYQFLTGGFQKRGQASQGLISVFQNEQGELISANRSEKPVITEDFLTPNPYSRPGERLQTVENIFVHYTANQGTSAVQNRSYFENLSITGETSASAHFVIGYEGEIIQCIPLDEIGYAVKQRNYDSISIECCYVSEDGSFTDDTYESLIRLCGWLLKEYQLSPDKILRHYDEGGKKCPLYYVEHEEAWEQFLKDVKRYIIEEEI